MDRQPENRMPSVANRWQRHKNAEQKLSINKKSENPRDQSNNSRLPYTALTAKTTNHWKQTLPLPGRLFSFWSWIRSEATLETLASTLPLLATADCCSFRLVLSHSCCRAFAPRLVNNTNSNSSITVNVTVTEALVLRPLLEDQGRITESIRILVPVDRMKQKCFQITTKQVCGLQQFQLCR